MTGSESFVLICVTIKIVLGVCTVHPLLKYIYHKVIDDIATKVAEKIINEYTPDKN